MNNGNVSLQKFSPKAFALGLGVVVLSYGALFSFMEIKGPEVLKEREGQLASRTVLIERVKPLALPVDIEQTPEKLPQEATLPPDEKINDAIEDSPAQQAPEEVVEDIAVSNADDPLKDFPKNASGLCIAPIEGLYEDIKEGRLPVARADGLTPFKAYKKPFTVTGKLPVISIAVMDVGLSAKISESAIKSLPPEISLIISPYADGPDMWTTEARNAGHEVWLSLPMESKNYPQTDSGPHTLLIGVPERENQEKLNWVMGRSTGYVGLVATHSRTFIDSANDARPILGSIYKRGIGFIDDSRMAGSVAETTALSMGGPFSNIDVWIDKPDNTPEIIKASLSQLEVIAKEQGLASGIITPNAISFRELQLWIETLKDKGIVLAPLSAQTGY